jgi:methionine-rich copper-binding protein CopC
MMKQILLAAGALALAAPAADAHAFLDRAIPAVGSTVPASPAELDLFYTEGVVPPFSNVAVQANGKDVAIGKPRNGSNTKELIVPLPKLPPGDYTVVWHVTSEDTHKTEGRFHFMVAP